MTGATASGKIAVAIKSQDGDISYYRIAQDKQIKDLLKTYCQAKNFKFREMNFIHNRKRIQVTKTLDELGIEDGDQIDAMGNQGGG